MHLPIMLRLLAQGLNVEDINLLWSREYGSFVEWQLVSAVWLIECARGTHRRSAADPSAHSACSPWQPGTPPVVHIADPEAIRQAFEVRNYPKSPLYAGEAELLCRRAWLEASAAPGWLLAWNRRIRPSPCFSITVNPSRCALFVFPPRPDLLPVLGESSMVISEGEQWRRQREAFNPGFSSTFLRAALPGFQVRKGTALCGCGQSGVPHR